jgi:RHH-type proline utilization regulon transcriptional repressor/proline dehydrogenase/delta 1-pyrroline-5-carboxylate dehydrogenase
VAAGLAAGNVVLAKPAEETPLVAAEAVRILLGAGVPAGVVQLLPGGGAVGAALVADARVNGVLFTGSTEVAKAIQRQLAARVDAAGKPVPLVAETGGQNAMVVDSSALPEQAVADILTSAFDSAGQRCSALRILLVQEEAADRVLTMLQGALAEFRTGRPDLPEVDMGPVISASAKEMRGRGFTVHEAALPGACREGFFVAPTVIEIPSVDVLGGEVFGPVLHVVRYRRDELERVISAVNALGFGLTFGIHSRIDEVISRLSGLIRAGNVYVNRTTIGAVVGVQPFGGCGLSGTGPKAGGPLYPRRLLAARPPLADWATDEEPEVFWQFVRHLRIKHVDAVALTAFAKITPLGREIVLPGPVGEQNTYRLVPRGRVLCVADTEAGLYRQVAAALATGNLAVVPGAAPSVLQRLPAEVSKRVALVPDLVPADVVLFEGDAAALRDLQGALCDWDAVVPVYAFTEGADYPLEFLLGEQVVSVNTAAAGGNAALMMVG